MWKAHILGHQRSLTTVIAMVMIVADFAQVYFPYAKTGLQSQFHITRENI